MDVERFPVIRKYFKKASVFIITAGLIFAFFSLIVLLVGANPLYIIFRLYKGTFGNPYGFAQVLFKATPIIFTALACAFSFRAGLFNVGMEGQGYIGAFAMAVTGAYLDLPSILLLPLSLLAGFIAGGIWGAVAGFLKAKYRVHEVISTIMLNFIAIAFINYFLTKLHVPETVHTKEISSSIFIMRFDSVLKIFKGSPLNLSFLFAVILAVIVRIVLKKSSLGFQMQIMEKNTDTARTYGISVLKKTVLVMFISGGIAGLIGMNFILGYKHYFEEGFIGSAGFIGIAASLIALNSPIGLLFSSIFFGFLGQGGLVVNAHIPKELMEILQALCIILVIAVPKFRKK